VGPKPQLVRAALAIRAPSLACRADQREANPASHRGRWAKVLVMGRAQEVAIKQLRTIISSGRKLEIGRVARGSFFTAKQNQRCTSHRSSRRELAMMLEAMGNRACM